MKPEEIIIEAVKAADRMKGTDISAIEVREASSITDYYLLMSGSNKLHTQALAREIDETLSKHDVRYLRSEGEREGMWILLDYGDVIVQIFHPEERQYYDLDRLWGDMPKFDISPYITED